MKNVNAKVVKAPRILKCMICNKLVDIDDVYICIDFNHNKKIGDMVLHVSCADELSSRINYSINNFYKKSKEKYESLLKKFKEGDWVFGIGKYKGCSQIFWGHGKLYPFDYLNDFNPENFRLATEKEIMIAEKEFDERRSENDNN